MVKEISSTDDVIDTRDICERIEELEAEVDNINDMPEGDMMKDTVEASDARAELKTLRALVEEIEAYSGDKCSDGVTMIRDSYFKDYAQELADDIGAIDVKATWPCNCIDWDQAARELQMDYSAVEFEGITFWIR